MRMRIYYRTDRRGNVRWHALGKNDAPLCGVGPGEDDHVRDVKDGDNVDCYRCRWLSSRGARAHHHEGLTHPESTPGNSPRRDESNRQRAAHGALPVSATPSTTAGARQ